MHHGITHMVGYSPHIRPGELPSSLLSNIWWCPLKLKHVHFRRGRHASYWNVFLLIDFLVVHPYVRHLSTRNHLSSTTIFRPYLSWPHKTRPINGLFTLPDLDTDSNSDSDCKQNGYIVMYKLFTLHTVRFRLQS